MRRATPLAIVAIMSACAGWYLGGQATAQAQYHSISAVSVVEGDGTRFYMVRDGQLLDCRWEAGEDRLSLHPNPEGFVCSRVRIKN